MVTLKEYSLKFEAELAKNYLESQGIKVFLFSDDQGGMQPSMSVVTPTKLAVAEEDFENAQNLLAIFDHEQESQN